MLKGDISGWFM